MRRPDAPAAVDEAGGDVQQPTRRVWVRLGRVRLGPQEQGLGLSKQVDTDHGAPQHAWLSVNRLEWRRPIPVPLPVDAVSMSVTASTHARSRAGAAMYATRACGRTESAGVGT